MLSVFEILVLIALICIGSATGILLGRAWCLELRERKSHKIHRTTTSRITRRCF